MLDFKLNKLLVKNSLSEEAYNSEQLSYSDKRLLAVVAYHFRKLHKSIKEVGYLFLNVHELMDKLFLKEEELDDACFNISELGYARVEQHGDWYWFFLDREKAMSQRYLEELQNLEQADAHRAIAAQMQQRIAEHYSSE